MKLKSFGYKMVMTYVNSEQAGLSQKMSEIIEVIMIEAIRYWST